ncbi:Nicotinamide-nucleotide adenylyltransferase [uncultured archaeon]|nr:Nicotinamide-nucleotide adenylyltransferase [uncultured archaeon]
MRKPTSLFIGRFQPFHKGHLSAVKWIAKKSGSVIIAIGSAQERNTERNPFSAKERMKMMRAQLSATGLLKKCTLVSVTDIKGNEKWAAHVDENVPRYDVVYSNNALVKRLMKKAGKTVRAVPFFSKATYNATKIRARMKKGAEWRGRVPQKVRKALVKLGAEEKLRRIN